MRHFLVFPLAALMIAATAIGVRADNQSAAESIAAGLSELLPNEAIMVRFLDGKVSLSGEVGSAIEMQKALHFVSNFENVNLVENEMVVVSSKNKTALPNVLKSKNAPTRLALPGNIEQSTPLAQPSSLSAPENRNTIAAPQFLTVGANMPRLMAEEKKAPASPLPAMPQATATQTITVPISGEPISSEQLGRVQIIYVQSPAPTTTAPVQAMVAPIQTAAAPIQKAVIQPAKKAAPIVQAAPVTQVSGRRLMQPAAKFGQSREIVYNGDGSAFEDLGATDYQPNSPTNGQANRGPQEFLNQQGTNQSTLCAGQPNLPSYAWPSYAAHPNYAQVTYPKKYRPSCWPNMGPFYPYPQPPLGWRKVTMEWHNGDWWLDFDDGSAKGPFSPLFRERGHYRPHE